jgi:hypothetical protein
MIFIEKVKITTKIDPYLVGLDVNTAMRPMCLSCNQRPRAVAYHKNNKIQYRKLCENCIKRGRKVKPSEPRWKTAGYKKKLVCDRCGFKSKYLAQLLVFYIDGNLNNNTLRNLKTVCQNCVIEIAKSDLPWRVGDLEPDR